jgi:hypothetical protein
MVAAGTADTYMKITSLQHNSLNNLPESGNELKSPHNNNWILFVSGLCPGRKLWLASSKILRSSLDSIMVWINFTSQNSGSQWIWAVHTRMGWCTWLTSGGSPGTKFKQNKCLQKDWYITYSVYFLYIQLNHLFIQQHKGQIQGKLIKRKKEKTHIHNKRQNQATCSNLALITIALVQLYRHYAMRNTCTHAHTHILILITINILINTNIPL